MTPSSIGAYLVTVMKGLLPELDLFARHVPRWIYVNLA